MGRRISYRDVLRHRANGRSIREIAAACSCSSSAVQDILARAEESGVGWDDVAPLTDDEARRLERGNPGKGDVAFASIDFERINAEMARDRTMTLSILWEEYYASAVSRKERPYLYSRFYELYKFEITLISLTVFTPEYCGVWVAPDSRFPYHPPERPIRTIRST